MRRLVLVALFLQLLTPAHSQRPINEINNHWNRVGPPVVYSDGGGFVIDGPKGWTRDRKTGRRLGMCCVYYPSGKTWNNAPTVMYPNLATKGPQQQTLEEFMATDLANFRKHNPQMTYEDAPDIALSQGRVAKVRYFYNVNRSSSEAVAYIDEEKIIALFTVSSRTKQDLTDSQPQMQAALQTYTYLDEPAVKAVLGKK